MVREGGTPKIAHKLLLTEERGRSILIVRFFQESIVVSRPYETDAASVGAFKKSAESIRFVRVSVLSTTWPVFGPDRPM